MSQTNKPLTWTVPLSLTAHSMAQQCCRGISNPQKAKQVYLNTLAVYVVDFYLRCLGFETDWEQSESRNPLMLKFKDVADLDVKQIGKIECRPVLPDAGVVQISSEVLEDDRQAYVAVQLSESLKEAVILGFTLTAAREVPLEQLRSLSEFLVYLNQIKQPEPVPVNLHNWFEGIIAAGWQAIDELLTPQQVELAFRFRRSSAASITKAKKIDLGMQLDGQSVALVVELTSQADGEVGVFLQVHPLEQTYLPPELQLIVSDSGGKPVLEATSRKQDNLLQLEFSAESGERFSVTVALGERRVIQEFIV